MSEWGTRGQDGTLAALQIKELQSAAQVPVSERMNNERSRMLHDLN